MSNNSTVEGIMTRTEHFCFQSLGENSPSQRELCLRHPHLLEAIFSAFQRVTLYQDIKTNLLSAAHKLLDILTNTPRTSSPQTCLREPESYLSRLRTTTITTTDTRRKFEEYIFANVQKTKVSDQLSHLCSEVCHGCSFVVPVEEEQ